MGHVQNGHVYNLIGTDDVIVDSRLRDDVLISMNHTQHNHLHIHDHHHHLHNHQKLLHHHHQAEHLTTLIHHRHVLQNHSQVGDDNTSNTNYTNNNFSHQQQHRDNNSHQNKQQNNPSQDEKLNDSNATCTTETVKRQTSDQQQLVSNKANLDRRNETENNDEQQQQQHLEQTVSNFSSHHLNNNNSRLFNYNQSSSCNDNVLGQSVVDDEVLIEHDSFLENSFLQDNAKITNNNNHYCTSMDSEFNQSEQHQSNDTIDVINTPENNIELLSDSHFDDSIHHHNEIHDGLSANESILHSTLSEIVDLNQSSDNENNENLALHNESVALNDSGIKLDSQKSFDEVDCANTIEIVDPIIEFEEFVENEVVDDEDDDDEDENEEGGEIGVMSVNVDDDNDDDEDDDDDDEDDDDDDDDDDQDDEINDCGHLRQQQNNIVDNERMLEVTRKLVRSTEKDPDRDLRKQVLLKTAIKKLPHFVDYNQLRYSNDLNGSFQNVSQQTYYSHHEPISPQPKFYHSVQPNAIQMSTTSLRMLDLNDDHDHEFSHADQEHLPSHLEHHHQRNNHNHHLNNINNSSNFIYANCEDLCQQQDYVNANHHGQSYNRYQFRTHELNQYDDANVMIRRHSSFDSLYHPVNGSDIIEDSDQTDSHLVWNSSSQILELPSIDTMSESDSSRKILNNSSNIGTDNDGDDDDDNDEDDDEDGEDDDEDDDDDDEDDDNDDDDDDFDDDDDDEIDESDEDEEEKTTTIDNDCSDKSSNSPISSEEGTVCTSQIQPSPVMEKIQKITLIETSFKPSNDFYLNSNDGPNTLYSSRSNKRSSSSIGLEDGMEVDHLIESATSPANATNGQFKKLRKKEIYD